MKKILIMMVISCIALHGAFAKKWTNVISAGFSVPAASFSIDESGADDIFQVGYGIDGSYLGIHESGFTAKAGLSAGIATSDDVHLSGNSTDIGFFYNLNVGAGWSFIQNENFMISATGMVGFDLVAYGDQKNNTTYNSYECKELYTGYNLIALNVGADLFASYKTSEHLGVFANIAVRYIPVGVTATTYEYKYSKDDGSNTTNQETFEGPSITGTYRIQPTIGICWKF